MNKHDLSAVRRTDALSGTAYLSRAVYDLHRPAGAPTARTLTRRYGGGWLDILAAADIPIPEGIEPVSVQWTDKQMIKALKAAKKGLGDLDAYLTLASYGRWREQQPDPLDWPHPSNFSSRRPANSHGLGRPWEDWSAAAGFKPDYKRRQLTYTDAEMLQFLVDAAADVGEPLTEAKYKKWAAKPKRQAPHPRSFDLRWGTWRRAVRAAGLVSTPDPESRVSPPVAMAEALGWAAAQGVPLTTARYKDWVGSQCGRMVPAYSTVVRHFGSWRHALDQTKPKRKRS